MKTCLLFILTMLQPVDRNYHGTIEVLFVTESHIIVFGSDTLWAGKDPRTGVLHTGEARKIVNCAPGVLCAIVGTASYSHAGPINGGDESTALELNFKFPDWLPDYADIMTPVVLSPVAAMCQAIEIKATKMLPDLGILAKAGNLRSPDPNEKTFFGITVVGYEPSGSIQLCHVRIDIDWHNGVASMPPSNIVTLSPGARMFTGECTAARAASDGTDPSLASRLRAVFPQMLIVSNAAFPKGYPEEVRVAAARAASLIQIESEINTGFVGGRIEISVLKAGQDGPLIVTFPLLKP